MQKDWNKMYTQIIGLLQEELPQYLTYHNWQHTDYVISKSEEIALAENIAPYEIMLIKSAALFHDLGFIKNDINHEEESIVISTPILKCFGYTEEEISKIQGMIRATKIPQLPKNKLEQILADADLEYLGTDTFKETGDELYKELKHRKIVHNYEQWNKIQVTFLELHHYHTRYCIEKYGDKKEANLRHLIEHVNKY